MDSGSPCPILLLINMGSEVCPSNLSIVLLPHSMLLMKFTYLLGTPCFCRLCNSLTGTALGKAPSMSRKRTATILPAHQVSLILYVRRYKASAVVRPGLPLKWLVGSSWCSSVRKEI